MALSGTEILYVNGVQANGQLGATLEQTTTGAIAALASSEVAPIKNTAITTVGAGTLTAAGIVGGLITRTGPVADYTDTTATALQIVAALPNYVAAESFFLIIKNGTNFTQTLTAGSGVTVTGGLVVPPSSYTRFLVTITSATAVAMLHIGTALLTNNTPESITTISTVGAGTLTAASIVSGVISRTGAQTATPFTDTTDTADLIIAAQANAHVGVAWELTYVNTTNAVATIAGGTGVTPSGITVVPAGYTVKYLVTYTAASTITMVAIAVSQAATSEQSLILAGSASGTTTINSGAAAGSSVLTLPVATDTLVGKATTDTLTNKTLTAPVIGGTGAVFNGSSSGTTTVLATAAAGSTTQTLPAVTGTVASTTGTNLYVADLKRASSTNTSTGGTTLTNIVGLSFTVVAGTYRVRAALSGVADGTGGIKYAFKYTTTVVSVLEITGKGSTAAAIATQHTTTNTDQALLFDQAAAVLFTELDGTIVVTTGGTIDIQAGLHANSGSSTVVLGSYAEFTRIA